MKDTPTILIVDDQPGICWAIAELARSMQWEAVTAGDAAGGMERLAVGDVDVLVLDIQLPGVSGLDALPQIKADHPDLPVVVITAHGTMATAIEAVQKGAFEYLLKPVDADTLRTVLNAAVGQRHRRAELTAATPANVPESVMIGQCPAMQEVFKQIALVAATDMPVLIQGETGTGKELAARAIHRYSSRAAGPFVAVNCSLLSAELAASELFGHEKGAFTGAERTTTGKVEAAAGGSLLLDEVGDLSAEAQAQLLRFLDDRQYFRVGSTESRLADVRVLAATNRPLRAAAMAGRFRRDLFFRLSAVNIELPALRDRPGDAELLVDHFVSLVEAAGISDDARAALLACAFPGNVRELRNAVSSAAALAGGGTIHPEHLPDTLAQPFAPAEGATLEQWAANILDDVLASGASFESLLARWEAPVLAAAMKRFSGNQARLAEALHMHRTTLRKKLRAHGLLDGAEE